MKKSLFILIAILIFSNKNSLGQSALNYLYVSEDSCSQGLNPSNTILGSVFITNMSTSYNGKVFWGDGTHSTFSQANYFNGYHTYAMPGTYTVTFILYDDTTPIDIISKSITTFCNVISGVVYKKEDSNCKKDSATEPLILVPTQIEVRKSGIPVDTINAFGKFYKKIATADLNSVFSLHVINPPLGSTLSCPSTGSFSLKFDTLDYIGMPNGFEFGFDCSSQTSPFDLSAIGNGLFRPVSNSYIFLAPRNFGCIGQSGTVTLNLSTQYSFLSSNPSPASVSGNIITWNFSNLSNTSNDNIFVMLNPVGTPVIGSTVTNVVTITPTTGDVNVTNNTLVMNDTVRASFDPNEKHVNPVGNITPGQKLTYTINFENLGNDTAFNIHIMDTLSNLLDKSSLKVITSSHAVSSQVFETTSSNVLKFDFANIKLADASNPQKNKGFVTYEINAKSNLAYGDVIENTASIFFDINPAVVTNTTKSKYPAPTGIPGMENAKPLSVYPNPANDQLFIKDLNQFKQVHVLNTLGQQVMTQNIKSGAESISISSLADGIYYIKAINENGTFIQKFVKQ